MFILPCIVVVLLFGGEQFSICAQDGLTMFWPLWPSYLYAATTLTQYSCNLLDRYPSRQNPYTTFHSSATSQPSEASH